MEHLAVKQGRSLWRAGALSDYGGGEAVAQIFADIGRMAVISYAQASVGDAEPYESLRTEFFVIVYREWQRPQHIRAPYFGHVSGYTVFQCKLGRQAFDVIEGCRRPYARAVMVYACAADSADFGVGGGPVDVFHGPFDSIVRQVVVAVNDEKPGCACFGNATIDGGVFSTVLCHSEVSHVDISFGGPSFEQCFGVVRRAVVRDYPLKVPACLCHKAFV